MDNFNGSPDEVGAFFHVEAKQVRAWASDRDANTGAVKPVEISHHKCGRKIIIFEGAVVEFAVRYYRLAEAMNLHEVKDQLRAQWRAHLALVRGVPLPDYERRLQAIEEKLGMVHHGVTEITERAA